MLAKQQTMKNKIPPQKNKAIYPEEKKLLGIQEFFWVPHTKRN